ncbi:unnamed protein product, partial [Durusdinium trenchii]
PKPRLLLTSINPKVMFSSMFLVLSSHGLETKPELALVARVEVNKSSASVPSLSSPPPTSVEMLQSQSEPSVAAQATIPTEHGAGDVPEEVVPDPPEECIPPSVDKEAGSAYLDPKAAGTMTPGRSIVSF